MNLSKSKLIAFRQCPKRLWLEVNKPDLAVVSPATQATLMAGNQVGEIARKIYDKDCNGVLIDIASEGFKQALGRSQSLRDADTPIFEAGFSGSGVLAFADVMLPDVSDGKRVWHMIEVKSSTSVKDYHRDDIAIQSFAAESSGFPLKSISLAHIDSSWTYLGNQDYSGLLKANDLTVEALSRSDEVKHWIDEANQVLAGDEPVLDTGSQCFEPFECGFYQYCARDQVVPEYPIQWLPRIASSKVDTLTKQGISDLRLVPNEMLNELQQRVKQQTILNEPYFDQTSAKAELSNLPFPAYFLDFETINLAVPIWAGTRPYQQVPFQFSLHVVDHNGDLTHKEFLDISGNSPIQDFADSLLAGCGDDGPVFVYNAAFETTRIKELAEMLPNLKDALLSINERIVDLLPIARKYYYHPSQQGSWSIKKVLPALVPALSYSNLEGVQDGGMAMEAFVEAIQNTTTKNRKDEIRAQLLEYCKLDTYAMVKLWEAFSGV